MDLNAPLGMSPPPKPPRRHGLALPITIGALVAAGALAAIGVFLVTSDPHGGEPYVVASITPAAPKPPPAAAPLDPIATATIAPHVAPGPITGAAPASGAPGSPVAPSSPNGPLIIDVAKALADREHSVIVPQSTSVMPSPHAAPAPVVATDPRVAIFIGGMGLSPTATRTATEIMPSAVTLAFVPYGETVAAAVAAAKAKGHEILLQVPMRNSDGAAPGPHALRPGEAAAEVAEDASWLLGRIEGYDGVSNLLGAPVTSDRNAMAALLKAVAARGLFYVDDGTSRRSLGPALALEQGLASARADVVLDATADPAVVRANLEALVAIAKRKGSAIGMASGLPDHLAAIAAFAAGLGERGVKLVPVSTLAAHNASVAVAR